ncbi:MAG: oxidoreductase [Pseudonocardiales bacterium]|nr:MAG: oxidoreductase [Pseudonocardiales bacterium]
MSEQIRAVVFGGPALDTSSTRVTAVALPEPGKGELSIDVQFAGINFKDVMVRRGDGPYVTSWPYVPGIEVAGAVRALGPGVDGFRLGQPVVAYMNDGGLAEVAVASAALTVPVPDGLDLAAAAAAPGALTTAVLLLEHGRLRAGDSVLVHSAAGAVGQAVVRLARLAGAGPVLAAVGSPSRASAAEAAGYDRAFVREPQLAQAVREHLGGSGVDLILDPQGTTQLDADLDMAAAAGRVVLFGNATGEPFGQLPPAGRLYAGTVSVGGFSLAALSARAPWLLAAGLSRTVAQLAAGELDPRITIVDGLDAAPAAQQALAESRASGKQVVRL